MLQYILNASATWGVSLLLFDLVLRRQRMHGYNRFYLLCTLALGALLPLVPLTPAAATYPAVVQMPVARVAEMRQVVAHAVTPAASRPSSVPWLLMLYLAGGLVAVSILVAEVVKLARMRAASRRSTEGKWLVLETGKVHAPFSLLHTLYVGSRQQYTHEEWQMILAHEGRHASLLHFADLVVLHLFRILFWFHPLVYAYHRRLMAVHEYQADAVAEEPQTYGRFLVEQAVFNASPSVAHSFNQSPLKSRIMMLQKIQSKGAGLRMLMLAPVVVIAVGCFTKESARPSRTFQRNGNEVSYNGNKIVLSEPSSDTIEMINPVTGGAQSVVQVREPEPISINGQKIYHAGEAEVPGYVGGNLTFESSVMSAMSSELGTLPDGDYALNLKNLVVDEKGKVAYYELGGLQRLGMAIRTTVANDTAERIAVLVDNTLNNAPALSPAKIGGRQVAYLMQTYFWRPIITVKDRKVTYANPPSM